MIGALVEAQAAAWSRWSRFVVELAPQPEQIVEWHTPNAVVLERPHWRLRRFEGEDLGRPMLVVPPEINGSNLCDYGPDQSLVETLLGEGFGPVFAIEWKSATAATKDLDVDDSIQAILDALDASGGPAHLLGICQGGWESLIVAAVRPEAVLTLTLAAAPVDFRGSGALTPLVDATPMAAYEAMVALGGGVMRGEYLRAGFTNLRFWERRVVDRAALWNRLDDPQWMERRHRMGRWYHAKKDLPGRAYLRVVRELFGENRLVRGEFVVFGEPVDLGRVRCPLAMVAGEHDHITHPDQLFAAEGVVGSTERRRWTLDAGHVGVVIKHGLPRWDEIAAWLHSVSPSPGL